MKRFSEQIVVITGAAKGIGAACGLRFAEEGAKIALLDKDEITNKQSAKACEAVGAQAITLPCDVREKDQVETAIQKVIDAWGRIDVLVTSAGIYNGQPLAEVTEADWHDVLQTNLSGIFFANQAVAPQLMAQKSGSIINISSMAGKTSWRSTAQYSASKSGVIGLTRSVAMELAYYGVTVNTVCPGNTQTPMLDQVASTVGASVGLSAADWKAKRAKDAPLGRLAEAWEIAGAVAFLASEDARYITGQALEVDGGMVLS